MVHVAPAIMPFALAVILETLELATGAVEALVADERQGEAFLDEAVAVDQLPD